VAQQIALPRARAKRETFAYSCETYARILELASTFRVRADLAAEFAEDHQSGTPVVT
jgi:hypothetical protein